MEIKRNIIVEPRIPFSKIGKGQTFIPHVPGLGREDVAIKTGEMGYTYLNTGNHGQINVGFVTPATLCEIVKGHFQED